MGERELSPEIVSFCERLSRLDAGDRARLKRNAGQRLAEARGVTGLFYRLLPPGVGAGQEDMYFLVATLFPLAEGGGRGDLGAALCRGRSEKHARGLDRRVEILLDADAAQLPFRLRRAVQLLASNRVGVNWPQLLADLLYWTHPERFVQRRWARSYFSGQPSAPVKGG